jgi:BlaI family transcriptional regulator, penicillinase repressor
MKAIPQISDAEWEIMKILWGNAPLTANDIIERLSPKVAWKPKTIKTLINRLLKKQAIHYRKRDRAYEYYPLVSKEECARQENQSFLNRVYDGELNLMLAGFLDSGSLSKKDIAELKRILDKGKDS